MSNIFKKLFGGSTKKNEPDLFELNGKLVPWAEYEASPEFAKARGAQGSAARGAQWVSGPQGAPLFCGEKTGTLVVCGEKPGTLIVCGGNARAPNGKSNSVI